MRTFRLVVVAVVLAVPLAARGPSSRLPRAASSSAPTRSGPADPGPHRQQFVPPHSNGERRRRGRAVGDPAEAHLGADRPDRDHHRRAGGDVVAASVIVGSAASGSPVAARFESVAANGTILSSFNFRRGSRSGPAAGCASELLNLTHGGFIGFTAFAHGYFAADKVAIDDCTLPSSMAKCIMGVQITIRDVPEDVRDELASRAARSAKVDARYLKGGARAPRRPSPPSTRGSNAFANVNNSRDVGCHPQRSCSSATRTDDERGRRRIHPGCRDDRHGRRRRVGRAATQRDAGRGSASRAPSRRRTSCGGWSARRPSRRWKRRRRPARSWIWTSTRCPSEPFAERVWELRRNVTSYDAWYVAVAGLSRSHWRRSIDG